MLRKIVGRVPGTNPLGIDRGCRHSDEKEDEFERGGFLSVSRGRSKDAKKSVDGSECFDAAYIESSWIK